MGHAGREGAVRKGHAKERKKIRRASGLLGDHWAFAGETDLAWEKETVQANGLGLAIWEKA